MPYQDWFESCGQAVIDNAKAEREAKGRYCPLTHDYIKNCGHCEMCPDN